MTPITNDTVELSKSVTRRTTFTVEIGKVGLDPVNLFVNVVWRESDAGSKDLIEIYIPTEGGEPRYLEIPNAEDDVETTTSRLNDMLVEYADNRCSATGLTLPNAEWETIFDTLLEAIGGICGIEL